jgi:stage V sporulation protein T
LKATGIVRRIDDLGRVVIPKEIRRTLRIREGDPLEIFVDREGEVILKKYSPIGELGDFAKEYADSLHETIGHISMIADRDVIIALSGANKREFLGKSIGKAVERALEERTTFVCTATVFLVKSLFLLKMGMSFYGEMVIIFESLMAGILSFVFIVSSDTVKNKKKLNSFAFEDIAAFLILGIGVVIGLDGFQWA